MQPVNNVPILGIPQIGQIGNPRQPRRLISGLGHRFRSLDHVRRREVQRRHGLHVRALLQPRHRGSDASFLHRVQQPGHEDRGRVHAERPGDVCVSEARRHVGHVLQHDAFPEVLFPHGLRDVVHGDLRAAADLELQARGCDDDVGVDVLARGKLDAGRRHGGDGVGDHRGFAGAHGFEEVSVRAETQALLPRVVAGFEMGVVRYVFRQLFDGDLFDQVPRCEGVEGAELDEEEAKQ